MAQLPASACNTAGKGRGGVVASGTASLGGNISDSDLMALQK